MSEDIPEATPVAEAPAAAPKPASTQSDAADRVDRAVDAWLWADIANSPVSRSTEAWNHLTSTLGALKAAILKEL